MGWSGGTDVFDEVAWYVEPCLYNEDFKPVIEATLSQLLSGLAKKDWDIKDESNYWTHPIIGRILGNTFEEEDDE